MPPIKVYRVREASDDYKHLSLDQRGLTQEKLVKAMDRIECGGVPIKKWLPPPMILQNPTKPEPDFWACSAHNAFAVHPRALSDVAMFLERAGQMLPLKFKGLDFTVLNVLEVYNCVDWERSECYTYPSTGKPYGIKKPYFIPRHFGASTLFKWPQQWDASGLNVARASGIHCWESTGDPEEEFKACVESLKLTGLRFELVWTEETKPKRRKPRK